jgi:magnesium chelatase family protein
MCCHEDMRAVEVWQFCKLDGAGQSLVRAAMGQMNSSARGYHRVLKQARTMVGPAGRENKQAAHLAEVLPYRAKLLSHCPRARSR